MKPHQTPQETCSGKITMTVLDCAFWLAVTVYGASVLFVFLLVP